MMADPGPPLIIEFRTTSRRLPNCDSTFQRETNIPRHLLEDVEGALLDCECWVTEHAFPATRPNVYKTPVDPRFRAAWALVHRKMHLDETLEVARLALTRHFRGMAPNANESFESPTSRVDAILDQFGFEVTVISSAPTRLPPQHMQTPSYWGDKETENAMRILLEWPASRCKRFAHFCTMILAICPRCTQEFCSQHRSRIPANMVMTVEDELDLRQELDHVASTGEHLKPFNKEVREHPSFPELVKLGDSTVKLAMFRLGTGGPDPLMWALELITGENPVPAAEEDDNNAVAQWWIEWGRQRGLLPDLSLPPRAQAPLRGLDIELW